MSAQQQVQTFGKKKTATAVALAREGKGLIKVNGVPLSLFGTPILRAKLYEPILLLQSFTSATTALASPLSRIDIRLRVSGGGHTSQIYALRQAIGKAVVAYVGKYEDAASALEVRKVLTSYDRTLLVADPRRCEPKKFGGNGARSRFQKSYVLIPLPPPPPPAVQGPRTEADLSVCATATVKRCCLPTWWPAHLVEHTIAAKHHWDSSRGTNGVGYHP